MTTTHQEQKVPAKPGTPSGQSPRGNRTIASQGLVLFIAWVISAMEGYDLAVYGASVPAILQDPGLNVDLAQVGIMGSVVGIGMLFGAGFAGAMVHRFGHLRLIAFGIAIFSLGMVANALAPTAAVFGIGRLVVGVGLGIVLPMVNAYVSDISEPRKVARNVGLAMSGYAIGAMCAPLLAALLMGQSYRWLYIIGIAPVVLVAFMYRRLPDSPVFLRRKGNEELAALIEAKYNLPSTKANPSDRPGRFLGLGALFAPGVRTSTLLFWALSFCGLLLVFGISAWLPTMLQAIGYSLGSALIQTVAMWAGVAAGVILGGRIAEVIGTKAIVICAFLVGAISLLLMSLQPPVWIFYILVFVSGFGFIGSQILGNALIATRYAPALRGNGLSWALAIGRVGAIVGPSLGAWVLTSPLSDEWNFYAFAIPALVGATAAALVPRMVGRPS